MNKEDEVSQEEITTLLDLVKEFVEETIKDENENGEGNPLDSVTKKGSGD